MTTTYDIQALAPAPDWVCVFAEEEPNGSITVNIHPLVGWATCRTAECDDNGVKRTPEGRVKWNEFKVTVPAIYWGNEVRIPDDIFEEYEGEVTPFRVVHRGMEKVAEYQVTHELNLHRKSLIQEAA